MFFSSPGDVFSYPKCYHTSKSHRANSGQILVSKGGGGCLLMVDTPQNRMTFQSEIKYGLFLILITDYVQKKMVKSAKKYNICPLTKKKNHF